MLLASGCVGAGGPPREPGPLEKLRAKTNAYASFHYKAELTDGKVTVPIEMAWRAPDRAILRYGQSYAILFADGVETRVEKKSTCRLPVSEMLETLKKDYGDLLPTPPTISFILSNWDLPMRGQGLVAALDLRPSGSRLGWIDEVLSRPLSGDVRQWGMIEWSLRDDGFLDRVKMGSTVSLAMKELTIGEPVDDAVFALPAPEGMIDITESRKVQRMEQMEESWHRWVLAARPDPSALEALVRTDLVRRIEPPKLIEFQRKNLDETIEAFRKQQPDASPEAVRERVEIARGKAKGSVEIMEEDLQKDFSRRLDRYLGGRASSDLEQRWRTAVARQIDLQIRRPLDQIFVEKLR